MVHMIHMCFRGHAYGAYDSRVFSWPCMHGAYDSHVFPGYAGCIRVTCVFVAIYTRRMHMILFVAMHGAYDMIHMCVHMMWVQM